MLTLLVGLIARQCIAADKRSDDQRKLGESIAKSFDQMTPHPARWIGCPISIGVMAESRPAEGLKIVQVAASDIEASTGFDLTVVDAPATSRLWVMWETPKAAAVGSSPQAFTTTSGPQSEASFEQDSAFSFLQRSGDLAMNGGVQLDPTLTPEALARELRWSLGEVLSGWDSMFRLSPLAPRQTLTSSDEPPFDVVALTAAAQVAGCWQITTTSGLSTQEATTDG